MRNSVIFAGVLLVILAGSVYAHDLFLRLNSYFLAPRSETTIALHNGTFSQSENTITRDRMLDVSIVGPGDRVRHPDSSLWWDQDQTTFLTFNTGDAGTYVFGVSTAPRVIELSGEEFNDYLAHDGVLDALAARQQAGTLDEPARERYSKHVKAIYQVGDERSGAYAHRLGYPIEIVPVQNPYELGVGDLFEVQVLRNEQPLVNQLVYASPAGFHGHDAEGNHQEAITTRTDAAGVARFELSASGHWYVRLIHMEEFGGGELTHESNWATLTFEIR